MLTDNKPILQMSPFAKYGIVDAQINKWIRNGIVLSCSLLHASQIVEVQKKKKMINQKFV